VTRDRGDRRRQVVSWGLLILSAFVLSSVMWSVRWDTAPQRAYPDSFWYARQAAAAAGMPTEQAERLAARTVCDNGLPLMPEQDECQSGIRAYAGGFNDRYDRIFTTRPGYPLFVAPFMDVFGVRGMATATAVLGVGSGILIAVAVRLLGGSPAQSLFASLLLFLLPSGLWLTRLVAEPGAIAAMLAALCGAAGVLRPGAARRTQVVCAVGTLLALAALTLVKPATGVLLAAGMAAAVVLIAVWEKVRDRRVAFATWALGGVAVVMLVAWQVAGALVDLPGAEETLQDKFTASFTQPDVPDPWSRLLDMNQAFWPLQLNGWLNGGIPFSASPFLALVIAGLVLVAWVAPGRQALLWLAAGATGVVSVVAHPVPSEVDRLLVYIWLPVGVGLALGLRRPERAASVEASSGSTVD
jgi:hypothetical protein